MADMAFISGTGYFQSTEKFRGEWMYEMGFRVEPHGKDVTCVFTRTKFLMLSEVNEF